MLFLKLEKLQTHLEGPHSDLQKPGHLLYIFFSENLHTLLNEQYQGSSKNWRRPV